MLRGVIQGLVTGAAMLGTIAPAIAQKPPLSALTRPRPAPDSDADRVPATAEAMGISPEVFARLNIPATATIPNRPVRLSDGYTLFDAPVALPGPVRGPVALAPGAVIFDAAVRVDERRWRSTAPIVIGAPFNVTVPAGATFGGSFDELGEARPCLTRAPYEVYTPPEDEQGEIYPGLCLGKRDDAGRYASARLMPGLADRPKPRDFAIAPVLLEPIAAGSSHPHFGVLLAVRRFRVTEVTGDSATIVLEMALDKPLEGAGPRDPFTALTRFGAIGVYRMPLQDGARISASGVTLTLHRSASGWTVEASGGFGEWASVSADGVVVRLGEVSFGPRVR